MARGRQAASKSRALVSELGLNAKQFRFLIRVWSGESAVVAYMLAYDGHESAVDSARYKAAASSASKLLKNDKVQAAFELLTMQEVDVHAATRSEKRGLLALMMRGLLPGTRPVDRARAIREDNLMMNEHQSEAGDDDEGYDPFDDALEAAQETD